jgi:hypothetical protein
VAVERRGVPPAFWPNHLKTYQDCPQRYYLQFVRRRAGRIVDRTAMKRGQVTHHVLANAFRHFRTRNSFPDGLAKQISDRLTASDYPSHDHWRQDVRMIGDWVDIAVETFDQRKSVIEVEKVYGYPFHGRSEDLPFSLQARVDLVLRRDDGAIEHLDWKTGKRGWVDEIQNITARIAVGRALKEPRVVSTVTFLSAANGEYDDSSVLSREEVRAGWLKIKHIASDIRTDDVWTPKQGPLCNWCPYFQHGCVLHRAAGVEA